MKLLVIFMVSFLLGVAVRAVWIMAFPLHVTAQMVGPQSGSLSELTLKTLMSMVWSGLLIGILCSGVAALVMLVQTVLHRKNTIKTMRDT
ncbi:hypothetical protein [Deinococcus misasensis]|uniref:hypothetical protein n=1 Tax=Deinococcus misasensis TaxID=392413 RepID=UPI000A66614A|nr:hypothetical protein [Deinococcus misasensis]